MVRDDVTRVLSGLLLQIERQADLDGGLLLIYGKRPDQTDDYAEAMELLVERVEAMLQSGNVPLGRLDKRPE